MNRRRVLCGCGAALFGFAVPAHAAGRRRTCALRSLSADDAALLRLPKQDYSAVVGGLTPVVTHFSGLFGTIVPIDVVMGPGAPDNAFAMGDGGGRMIIGEPVLDRYKASTGDWFRLIVAGIIAHEFAHLWQMRNMPELLSDNEPSKLAELHADFLAGYALSFHKRRENLLIDAFAREMFSLGDTQFNSPAHHGAPEERRAAMIEGFKQGIQPATPPPIGTIARNAELFARASRASGA